MAVSPNPASRRPSQGDGQLGRVAPMVDAPLAELRELVVCNLSFGVVSEPGVSQTQTKACPGYVLISNFSTEIPRPPHVVTNFPHIQVSIV